MPYDSTPIPTAEKNDAAYHALQARHTKNLMENIESTSCTPTPGRTTPLGYFPEFSLPWHWSSGPSSPRTPHMPPGPPVSLESEVSTAQHSFSGITPIEVADGVVALVPPSEPPARRVFGKRGPAMKHLLRIVGYVVFGIAVGRKLEWGVEKVVLFGTIGTQIVRYCFE